MNWSLLIFTIIVVFFAWRGYKRGLLKSLSRVVALLAGYVCAIMLTSSLRPTIEAQFQIEGIVSLVCTSMGLFLTAFIAVSLIFSLIGKLGLADNGRSTISNTSGAMVGAVIGSIVAIVVVWAVDFASDMQPGDQSELQNASETPVIESISNRVISGVVGKAMEMASVSPQIAQLSKALIESPAEMTQQVQRLSSSNDFTELLANPQNQAVLDSGDLIAVMNLPAFNRLINNPDLQALAISTGMAQESEQGTVELEARLAAKLTDIWGRTQRVKNDKRVLAIINDPEFQQKIQSGNPVDLLSNDKLLELANIILSDDGVDSASPEQLLETSQSSGSSQSSNEATNKPAAKKPAKIYKWTDDSGRVHYSNVPQK